MDEWIVNDKHGTIWKYIKVHKIKTTSYEDEYGQNDIELIDEIIIKGIITKTNSPEKWSNRGFFEGNTAILITNEVLNSNDFVFYDEIKYRIKEKTIARWDMNVSHYEYELEKVGDYE